MHTSALDPMWHTPKPPIVALHRWSPPPQSLAHSQSSRQAPPGPMHRPLAVHQCSTRPPHRAAPHRAAPHRTGSLFMPPSTPPQTSRTPPPPPPQTSRTPAHTPFPNIMHAPPTPSPCSLLRCGLPTRPPPQLHLYNNISKRPLTPKSVPTLSPLLHAGTAPPPKPPLRPPASCLSVWCCTEPTCPRLQRWLQLWQLRQGQ